MMRPPRGVCAFISLHRLLRAQERAGQVDVDDALPLLERQVLDRDGRRADARVVEQDVEPAERRVDAREKRPHRQRIGDVGRHGERVRRHRARGGNRLFEGLLAPAGQRDRDSHAAGRPARRRDRSPFLRRSPARPSTACPCVPLPMASPHSSGSEGPVGGERSLRLRRCRAGCGPGVGICARRGAVRRRHGTCCLTNGQVRDLQ